MKNLTAKEKLFCVLFAENRNGREAAARAGYAMPQKTAVRLLEKKSIRAEISALSKSCAADLDEVCQGYRRLAFGTYADALKLLFAPEGLTPDSLEKLDMFNVSEIKRPKDGALEIKFFDRLKALEHLQQAGALDASQNNALPFYTALERSVGSKDEKPGEM